ncbi:AMP-binding protein [Tritonibacter litoralis]|nr:AMP-binding protein [Tritonibacter litoralis]
MTHTGAWDLPDVLNMAEQALSHPASKTAIVDVTEAEAAARTVSFGELNAMVDDVARYLLTRLSPGDRVGVLLSQTPWCAAAHLAAWKIGLISVPLFKLFGHDALASRMRDADLGLVLTDAAGILQVGDLAEAVDVAQVGLPGEALEFAATTPETPAILIYTSGTTGSPKGALHGHCLLTGHLPGVWLSHDHLGQEGDCLWTPADWAWIGGLFDVLMPGLALGVPVVAARLEKFTAEACQDVLTRGQVRNVFFPPTALRMLKSAPPQSMQGFRRLRSIASGGEPLGAEMLAWGRSEIGLTINEFYGQTECNMVVSACQADFAPRPGCIGRAVPGHQVAVIDPEGHPTAAEGDVAIHRGSPSMMLNYWRRPQETAEKFRGPWLVTGDRAVMKDGFVQFLGRQDDVITSGGYRIGPSEIEDSLMTHPAVEAVGVVGKPDPLRTEIVKAFVVLKPGFTSSASELQDYAKARLAQYSYPREVEFITHLPLTVTGKVLRAELKQRVMAELEGKA